LLTMWTAITTAEAILWIVISTNDGRFLYPALAPLAVVAALGWAWVLGRLRVAWLAPVLLAGGLAISASCAWLVVAPAYAYPATLSQLPASARPVLARFDDAVELVGVEAPTNQHVTPGQPYDVTLYWRLAEPEELPLSSFVHFDSADAGYQPGTGYEGAPGKGLYPPNFWQPDQIVVDKHTFVLAPDTRLDRRNAVNLSLRVGMYYLPPERNGAVQRVAVDPPEDEAAGVEVARWKVAGQAPAPAGPALAVFGSELELEAAQAQPGDPPSTLAVNLAWRARMAPSKDYTVTVQVLSADGQLVTQHDSRPLEGRYPTTRWAAGEQVFDSLTLALPRPLAAGDHVTVGVYALPSTELFPTATGARFAMVDIGPP
jgi:hypothetical protein